MPFTRTLFLLPGLASAQLDLLLQGTASDLAGAGGRDCAEEAQPLKPLKPLTSELQKPRLTLG